jgi:GLPGLI family protein
MKKTLLLFCLLNVFLGLNAQNLSSGQAGTEGVVLYEETVNLHRMIPDSMLKQMGGMIPETRSTKMELYFKGDESLYKPFDDPDEPQGGGGGGMMIRMGGALGETYQNLATEKLVEQREMFGKKFLIDDTLKIKNWKLGTDVQTILGYKCTKATMVDSVRMRGDSMTKRNITAWFTEDVPLAMGPSTYGSLPGLVLAVDVNNGQMTTVAKKIDFKKVKEDELKVPTKGEKMTRKEFDEKLREMMKKQRGNGTRIIRQG